MKKVDYLIIITSVLVFIVLILQFFVTFKTKPSEFEYKKHTYIYFPNKGVVHSPDCEYCLLTFD